MPNFGDWFTDRLRERHMTAADAAQAMDIKDSSISRWRSQGSVPNIKTVRLIADRLHIPVLEVLVAAGYLSADEARLGPQSTSLYLADSTDLLAEIERRITDLESRLGQSPPPADVRPLRRVARRSDPRPDDSADL